MSEEITGNDIYNRTAKFLDMDYEKVIQTGNLLFEYISQKLVKERSVKIKGLGTFSLYKDGDNGKDELIFKPAQYLDYLANPYWTLRERELDENEAKSLKLEIKDSKKDELKAEAADETNEGDVKTAEQHESIDETKQPETQAPTSEEEGSPGEGAEDKGEGLSNSDAAQNIGEGEEQEEIESISLEQHVEEPAGFAAKSEKTDEGAEASEAKLGELQDDMSDDECEMGSMKTETIEQADDEPPKDEGESIKEESANPASLSDIEEETEDSPQKGSETDRAEEDSATPEAGSEEKESAEPPLADETEKQDKEEQAPSIEEAANIEEADEPEPVENSREEPAVKEEEQPVTKEGDEPKTEGAASSMKGEDKTKKEKAKKEIEIDEKAHSGHKVQVIARKDENSAVSTKWGLLAVGVAAALMIFISAFSAYKYDLSPKTLLFQESKIEKADTANGADS